MSTVSTKRVNMPYHLRKKENYAYSPPPESIHPYPRDISLWDIYTHREELAGKPPFQRLPGVWGIPQMQALWDTIARGFEPPPIIAYEGPGGELLVADGGQRIESICLYFANGFCTFDGDQQLELEPEALKIVIPGMYF